MTCLGIIAAFFMLWVLAIGFFVVLHQRNKADAKLARWRSAWSETDRWLAEFPDVESALFHLKSTAEGDGGTNIMKTRETMRLRRDGKVQP